MIAVHFSDNQHWTGTKATGNSRFETENPPPQPKNSRKFPLMKMKGFLPRDAL